MTAASTHQPPARKAAKVWTGATVFDAALARLTELYEQGDRVVVSFSGGKDSGLCVELAIIAARLTGRLPVDVVCRDEEIMYPGTYEYVERVANRPEVNLKWLVSHHAIPNVFNREDPWWWTFDRRLSPSDWVRLPPPWAVDCEEPSITRMTIPERFPIQAGQRLIAVTGLRAKESHTRFYSVYAAGGHLTLPNGHGVRQSRPLYDWTDQDVWHAYKEYGWEYNRAYDLLLKMGATERLLRIGPPSLNVFGVPTLQIGAKAWPQWFDRVCARLPGIRTVAMFGQRVVTPRHRYGESWRDTFSRECIDEAPPFVRARSEAIVAKLRSHHRAHTGEDDLPEIVACRGCPGRISSYKVLAKAMYNGDPVNSRVGGSLPDLEKTLRAPWLPEVP